MYLNHNVLVARQTTNDPGGGDGDKGNPSNTDGSSSSPDKGGISPVGIFFLVIFILLLIGFAGYVVYTHLRARRLGLPTPSLRSYIPFANNSSHYRSRAASGSGPVDWMRSKLPSKLGGGGGGVGASGAGGGIFGGGSTGYTGASTRSQRSAAQFGAVPGHDADDEAWDARGYGGWDGGTEMRPESRGQPNRHAPGGVTNTSAGSGVGYDGVSDIEGGRRAGRNPHRSMEFGYGGYVGEQEGDNGHSNWRPESGDTFTGVSVKGGRPSLEVSGGAGYENGGRRSAFRESM